MQQPQSADRLSIVGALTNDEKRHALTLNSGEIKLADQDTVIKHGQFARALVRQMGEMPVAEMIDAAPVAAIAARFAAAETAMKNTSEVWLRAYNLLGFCYAFRHDPAESLQRMKASFLAIDGSLDAQVPVKSNLGAMAQIPAAVLWAIPISGSSSCQDSVTGSWPVRPARNSSTR